MSQSFEISIAQKQKPQPGIKSPGYKRYVHVKISGADKAEALAFFAFVAKKFPADEGYKLYMIDGKGRTIATEKMLASP